MGTLRRRLEALEKALSVRDKAREETIKEALHRISLEELDLLIDAMLALRQGRELTEREAAAKQAYTSALETRCVCRGLTVRGILDVSKLIAEAVIRKVSDQDLDLLISGGNAVRQGPEPTAAELAAFARWRATKEAQYRRAGFGSLAEFESWYASDKPALADRGGMGGKRWET